MTIAFLVNKTHKEEQFCTTSLLGFAAHKRGHTIWYIGMADFVYLDNEEVHAHVRVIEPHVQVIGSEDMLEYLKSCEKAQKNVDDLDILWLRFDPSEEISKRPWASAGALQFARMVKKKGKMVINDPFTLTTHGNKLYLEEFDAGVRPKTMITKYYKDVINFMRSGHDNIILKPLQGSTGRNVFYIGNNDLSNLKQIVETLSQEGYFIVQEYIPAASNGDVRFYLLDGDPIVVNGNYACLLRVPQLNDVRSNIHKGGLAKKAEVNSQMLKVVDTVREKLIEDGMFFVGLDIVGDKLLEINVFSPGGLAKTNEINDHDFSIDIIERLEKKYAGFLK